MIDLHSHILPGLDDGPRCMDESLALARTAVRDGISVIYATPHHCRDPYWNEPVRVRDAARELNAALQAERIPLSVRPGQEIRVGPTFVRDAYDGKLLTLGDSPYVLLEFPSSHVPKDIDELLHELSLLGWRPIIAHPERNAEIAAHPQRLYALVEAGALCQITSHSLTGLFGKATAAVALDLCRRRLVHFISSDAHDVVRRPFVLGEAYQIVRRRIGPEWADYFERNARAVASGLAVQASPLERQPASAPYGVSRWLRKLLSAEARYGRKAARDAIDRPSDS